MAKVLLLILKKVRFSGICMAPSKKIAIKNDSTSHFPAENSLTSPDHKTEPSMFLFPHLLEDDAVIDGARKALVVDKRGM